MRNTRTGLLLATTLEGAFESAARNRGLLGRDHQPEGHALVIAPSNMVHTFFMRFPIDIALVSRNGKVLKIRTHVPARRIVGALRAFAVIELPAGSLALSQTQVGDVLEVVPL